MTIVPFPKANRIGDRFLSLLSDYGIQPPLDSALEDELLSLYQLIQVTKNPSLAQCYDAATVLRSAAELHDLAAKVLSVENHTDFHTFIPHLRLIADSKDYSPSIRQNEYSDTARKMAELYMGCLAAHVGTDVMLDSPTNPKGDNPDVMFNFKPCHLPKPPQRWTLAVKAISSRHGQTIFENIQQGAKQIDAPECTAQKGMVVINATSALNHGCLWDSNYTNEAAAFEALSNQLDNLVSSANNRPQAEWDALFTGKVVRPILLLGRSLVLLPTKASKQTPTTLKMLRCYCVYGPPHPVAEKLAWTLNDYMQKIL